MTKTCGKKQTNKSLPDVCNANLRNAEHTGETNARVALQARLEKLPSLEQEPGILIPQSQADVHCIFPVCILVLPVAGREQR